MFAVPITLTESTHCQSSEVSASRAPNCCTPTFAHSTLQLPKRSATSAAAASSDARSATSTPRPSASVPASTRPAATDSAASRLMSRTATRMPSAANAAAMAAPRPDPPPVTTAVPPASVLIGR